MLAYENVVGGKLKLKGKALDVKAGGVKKKKKKNKSHDQVLESTENELLAGVCFPLGKGIYRVLHIPEDEAVLLNSREKAPYLICVEVLKCEMPSNSKDASYTQKLSNGGGSAEQANDPNDHDNDDVNKSTGEENAPHYDDHLTPAD